MEVSGSHLAKARSRSLSRGPAAKRARAIKAALTAPLEPGKDNKSLSRGRSKSAVPRDEQGVKDVVVGYFIRSILKIRLTFINLFIIFR